MGFYEALNTNMVEWVLCESLFWDNHGDYLDITFDDHLC